MKTNFSKVEETLNAELEKMRIERILARSSTSFSSKNSAKQQILYLLALEKEALHLAKKHKDLFKKILISKKVLKNFIEHPDQMSEKDWKNVEEVKKRLEAFKKERETESDEELVEKERKRHLTKRFNVNEKWLPLD